MQAKGKIYVCKGCNQNCILETPCAKPSNRCLYSEKMQADWQVRKGQRKLVYGNIDWEKRLNERTVQKTEIPAGSANILKNEFGSVKEGVRLAVKNLVTKLDNNGGSDE